MKLEDKLQQVLEATTQVEAKIHALAAERDALRDQVAAASASVGTGSGELTPDQEASLDQAIARLRAVAA